MTIIICQIKIYCSTKVSKQGQNSVKIIPLSGKISLLLGNEPRTAMHRQNLASFSNLFLNS